jgi:hypothetical protein
MRISALLKGTHRVSVCRTDISSLWVFAHLLRFILDTSVDMLVPPTTTCTPTSAAAGSAPQIPLAASAIWMASSRVGERTRMVVCD